MRDLRNWDGDRPLPGTELAMLREEILGRFGRLVERYAAEGRQAAGTWIGSAESMGCNRWMGRYYAAVARTDPFAFATRRDYLTHLLELIGRVPEDEHLPEPRRAIDTVTRVLIGHLTRTDEAALSC